MKLRQHLNIYSVLVIFALLCPIYANAQNVNISAQINNDTIKVTFQLPENRHQLLQKDFFNIGISPLEGLQFSDTMYPEGPLNDNGVIEYHDAVTLKRTIKVLNSNVPDSLTIKANYQLCTETGACLFPESKEFTLALKSNINIDEIPGQ